MSEKRTISGALLKIQQAQEALKETAKVLQEKKIANAEHQANSRTKKQQKNAKETNLKRIDYGDSQKNRLRYANGA